MIAFFESEKKLDLKGKIKKTFDWKKNGTDLLASYQRFIETISPVEPGWTDAGTRFGFQCQILAFKMKPAQF